MNTSRMKTAVIASVLAFATGACDSPSETKTVRLEVRTNMAQEVTTTPTYQGDPDGAGVAELDINADKQEVCWDLSVQRITLPATAAHIHKAPAQTRGDIVVTLSPPNASGTAAGCAANLDAALLTDIVKNPTNYYVNVHTTDFAPGALRGQLH